MDKEVILSWCKNVNCSNFGSIGSGIIIVKVRDTFARIRIIFAVCVIGALIKCGVEPFFSVNARTNQMRVKIKRCFSPGQNNANTIWLRDANGIKCIFNSLLLIRCESERFGSNNNSSTPINKLCIVSHSVKRTIEYC